MAADPAETTNPATPAMAGSDGESADDMMDRKIGGALTRFRVLAYVVGVCLLILVAGMVLKYGFDDARTVEAIGPIHGFIYAVYLAITLDLALRAKWSVKSTLLVLLAGTVPFVSFWAERVVVRRTRAGDRL